MNRLLFWRQPTVKPVHNEKFYAKGCKSDFCSFPKFSEITGKGIAQLGLCGYTRWAFAVEKSADGGSVSVLLDCAPLANYTASMKNWSVTADIRVRFLHQRYEEKSVTIEENAYTINNSARWTRSFELHGFVKDDCVAFQIFVGITEIRGLYSPNFIDFSANTGDKVLIAGGVRFHVQKQVLSLQSPVFRAMFSGNFVENEEVTIREVNVDSFHLFLQYLHMAPIVICEANICDLLELADRFLVRRVVRDCEEFLISSKMEEQKVIEIATFYNLDPVLCEIIHKKKTAHEVCEAFPTHELLQSNALMYYLERTHNGELSDSESDA